MSLKRLQVCMLAILGAGTVPAVAGPAGARTMTAFFQGLGDLPGGVFFSEAADVSADGSTVVGFVPTVSEWGMVVMTLLLLTAGIIVLGRRCPTYGS